MPGARSLIRGLTAGLLAIARQVTAQAALPRTGLARAPTARTSDNDRRKILSRGRRPTGAHFVGFSTEMASASVYVMSTRSPTAT